MVKEIAVDYGSRSDRPIKSVGRCVQDYINGANLPGFSELEDVHQLKNLIVLLRSNTVSLPRLRELGVETYPKPEVLELVGNKLRFNRKLEKMGVLCPPTRLLPSRYLQNHLDAALQGTHFLVKPMDTIGYSRGLAPQVSFPPFNDQPEIYEAVREHGVDFVWQKLVKGQLKKAFALKPDVAFEYGYQTDKHYELEKGIDKSSVTTQVCHPIVQAKLQYLLERFGLFWSGIDYIDSDQGRFIYLIDINPTNGGRRPPSEYRERVEALLEQHLNSLRHSEENFETINKQPLTHRVVILAAGKNERLQPRIGARPKSLVKFGDVSVLDRVLAVTGGFGASETTILYPQQYEDSFKRWKMSNRQDQVILKTAEVASGAAHTPANDAFYTVKSNEVLTVVAADRLINSDTIPRIQGLFSRAAQEFESDDELVMTFFAIPGSEDSKYTYYIDENDVIIDVTGPDNMGISPKGGRYSSRARSIKIKKFAVMVHGAKIPFLDANSLDDVVRKTVSTGLKVKMTLLPGINWHGDLDTPEDLLAFEQQFGRMNVE